MNTAADSIVILGTTASGKTTLGVAIARIVGAEMISADSRQVYTGMDLGTGKDLNEYSDGGLTVPVHMIDILDPTAEFDVYNFKLLCLSTLDSILSRNKIPIIVGGTGLYLSSIIQDYAMARAPMDINLRKSLENLSDEELFALLAREVRPLHNTTDTLDRQRALRALEITRNQTRENKIQSQNLTRREAGNPRFLIIGVRWPREELHERIRARLDQRIADGMIEEVRILHENGLAWERFDTFGLEYRYVSRHLRGLLGLNAMRETLAVKIRQFAKRQDAWFKKMEREGVTIHWIDRADMNATMEIISEKLPWTA